MRTSIVVASLASCLIACGSRPAGRLPVEPVPATTPPTSTAPAPPPVADPAPPAFRLPGDVRPTRGELELTIVPDRERLDGIARYAVDVVRPTAVVWLDATGLDIAGATIGGRPARVVAGTDDVIGLAPPVTLAVGPTTIEVRYRAPIDRERSVGVYAEREGDEWYAYTFFEAIDARRAFPGFDEPGYKIPWRLSFHVRQDHVALGNAAVVAETAEPGGMKRVDLAETRPLPSYLVAFVVGPFELVDGGTAGRAATPVRFVVPRGRAAETRYAREITPRVVAALEDYFDMPYPYGKLDVAVVPRFWGTMEHPGLLAMGQPLTLIPPDAETTDRKRSYTNILAHELAHYWFGDLVTMAWWDDTWLNEGLATWMDGKITDAVVPAWRYADGGVANGEEAMASDELLAARAMRQPVDSKDGIQASFDNSTTYAKGAAVLTMFEGWLGADRVRDVIRAYVRAHADGNATADDLFAALAAGAGAEAAAALRTFVEQPGAPLVTMAVRCDGTAASLHLAQRRALPAGVAAPTEQRWHVPVCVRTGTGKGPGTRTCALLTTAEADVALPGRCPRWLVANADGAGYYRSTVTGAIGAPPPALLTRRERLRAIGDIGAARARGDVDLATALSAGVALMADRDAKIALWAGGLLAPVRVDVLDDDTYARFLRLLDRTLGPRARKLGWRRRPGDDDDTQALRLAIVPAIAERDRTLGDEATRLARLALTDRGKVDDDLLGAVLRVAARRGDRALYDQIVAAARATTDRRHRARLLSAVGAFVDPAVAADARALVLAGDFDLRETRGIVFAQLGQRATRDGAWAWLRAVAPGAIAAMRDDEAAGMIGAVAGLRCDPTGRAEAEAMFTPLVADVDGAAHELASGLERADRCIADLARELPALRAFLARY